MIGYPAEQRILPRPMWYISSNHSYVFIFKPVMLYLSSTVICQFFQGDKMGQGFSRKSAASSIDSNSRSNAAEVHAMSLQLTWPVVLADIRRHRSQHNRVIKDEEVDEPQHARVFDLGARVIRPGPRCVTLGLKGEEACHFKEHGPCKSRLILRS